MDIISSEFQSAARTASAQLRSYEAKTYVPRPPRQRSHLGRLTVAAALVVVGVLAMLQNAGILTISPGHYPAVALLVVGAGLLAGSLWGRSRGLIFLGLIIVPLALVASFVDVPFDGGVGYRSYTPATPDETAEGYHLFAGQMDIDLREMDWSRPVRLDATVVFGEIRVTVPEDVGVVATSHVGAGSILHFGQERAGTSIDFETNDQPGAYATKTLRLDAEASFGQIVVDRADAARELDGNSGPLPPIPAIPSPPAPPVPPVPPFGPSGSGVDGAFDKGTIEHLFPIGGRS
jgi:hypothetical protein